MDGDQSPVTQPPRGGGHPFTIANLPGYFLQDEKDTVEDEFHFTTKNFGLINRPYPSDGPDASAQPQWQRFAAHLAALDAESPPEVSHRVIFLARHGEGFHNQAERMYGTPAWDSYWSLLEGDGEIEWGDSLLNPEGEGQIRRVNEFWRSALQPARDGSADGSVPAPERYFVSPMRRCLQTANITFSNLDLPEDRPFLPTIKEDLREELTIHTCDRRSKKTEIARMFPGWRIEDGFAEDDPYWSPTVEENETALCARAKRLLNAILAETDATFISLTAHSGFNRAFLEVVGHREFGMATADVIPVLLRVRRNE